MRTRLSIFSALGEVLLGAWEAPPDDLEGAFATGFVAAKDFLFAYFFFFAGVAAAGFFTDFFTTAFFAVFFLTAFFLMLAFFFAVTGFFAVFFFTLVAFLLATFFLAVVFTAFFFVDVCRVVFSRAAIVLVQIVKNNKQYF